MEHILILEDQDEVFKGLTEIFTEIDPELHLIRFTSFLDFSKWAKGLLTPTPAGQSSETASVEKDDMALLILNADLMGPQHMKLVDTLGSVLKEKGKLQADSLPVLFLCHESDEDFSIANYRHPTITNIIFRPFDRVVTSGKILWALYGPKSLGKFQLYKETPQEMIEMRKELKAFEITEIGFKTVSERELKEGEVACYYNFPFIKDPHHGIFGICRKSESLQGVKPLFQNIIEFLSLDLRAIQDLKSFLQDVPPAPAPELTATPPPLCFAVIHEDPVVLSQIKEQLVDSLANIQVRPFSHFLNFLLEVNPESGCREIVDEMNLSPHASKEVELFWDEKGESFIKFEKPLAFDDLFGFKFNDMANFKRGIVSSLTTEEDRKRFTHYWEQGAPFDIFLIKNVLSGKPFYSVLTKRELVPAAQNKKTLRFLIRPAKSAEIQTHLQSNKQKSSSFHGVMVSERNADARDGAYWAKIRDLLLPSKGISPVILRIGSKALNSYDQVDLFKIFDGHFTEITDRSYLSLWLNNRLPQLHLKKSETSRPCRGQFLLEAGVRVQLKSVSEVSVSLSYPRALPIHRSRTFTIWDPETKLKVVLRAKCIAVEKDETVKDHHIHSFVFFGLKEQDNQLLRRWMINQYHLNKSGKETD